MSSEIDRMLGHYGDPARSGPSGHAEDDAHMRNVLLDEEARQNLAAQPYPAEWGRMPSEAGPFGDALNTFSQTTRGPAAPMSGMSPEARREILMHAATLLGLGHNPMTEAIGMGRANGGPVPDISNTLAQYGGTPEATGGSPFWWLNQSMLQPYNPPPLPQADAPYVGSQPQIMAPPSLPPAAVAAPVALPGPTGGPMQGTMAQPLSPPSPQVPALPSPVANGPADPKPDVASPPPALPPPVASPVASAPQPLPPATAKLLKPDVSSPQALPTANPGPSVASPPSIYTSDPQSPIAAPPSPPSLISGYADGGAVDEELAQYSEPERGFDTEKFKRGIGQLAQRAWDARPWRGYAENPPSPWPALGIAAGLLHPRLGGAVRDMAMARQLRGAGDLPAALPEGMPMHRRQAGVTNPEGIGVGPHGTFQPTSFEQFLAAHGMQARNPSAEADRILRAAYDLSLSGVNKPPVRPEVTPANVNARNPKAMRPDLSVVRDFPD